MRNRQVLISTHSTELLSDAGIGGEEVLLLAPTDEGTKVKVASDLEDIRPLLHEGIPVGDLVIPRTRPENISELETSYN